MDMMHFYASINLYEVNFYVEELNLIELINLFLRKWWLILIFAVVAGTGTYLFNEICLDPTYQTDGSFYVNIDNPYQGDIEEVSQSKLVSSTRLAITYSELLKSRTFLDEVSNDLYLRTGIEYTAGKIKNMLDVSSVNETEIISLTVTTTDPNHSFEVLNSVMALAPSKITSTVGGGSVAMVDQPYVPSYPTGPNKTRNTLIGIAAGIILSLLLVFILDLLDTHIKSSEEVKAKYKLPILGEIPQFDGDR